MGSPVSPIVANLYMEYFEQKALSTTPHPWGFGTGMLMTHLSSVRKSTNRTSYNTSTVLTMPFSLQWRTIRRMGPSPSWIPLLNQRLMVTCLSLWTGNLPTQTSTYSATVTITSQPSLVLSTHSPIGSKQYAAIQSFSTKRGPTWWMYGPIAIPQMGFGQGWREGLTSLPVRLLMGLTTRAPQVPSLLPVKLKSRVHIVIPYTQGLCESIKKICGRYGTQTYFKGSNTIRNLLVYPKDKDLMVSKSGAIYWFQCGDLSHDDEYIGETSWTFGERY